MCLKKQDTTVEHNFGKYSSIFKFLSLTDSQGNSTCNCYKSFISTFISIKCGTIHIHVRSNADMTGGQRNLGLAHGTKKTKK